MVKWMGMRQLGPNNKNGPESSSNINKKLLAKIEHFVVKSLQQVLMNFV